jgi:crotonobetainyl-CoA:carnitine CoA-transferase CaiB-like acyl-CoA transferase
MHARGALEWFDDPELGRIVLPASPIVLHGIDRVATVASPALGQHNQDIYGDWLGLSDQTLAELKHESVI